MPRKSDRHVAQRKECYFRSSSPASRSPLTLVVMSSISQQSRMLLSFQVLDLQYCGTSAFKNGTVVQPTGTYGPGSNVPARYHPRNDHETGGLIPAMNAADKKWNAQELNHVTYVKFSPGSACTLLRRPSIWGT